MINYILNSNDLIDRNISEEIEIQETYDYQIIKHCIKMFNNELNWDLMFNLDDAQDRILNGHKFFVAYHEKNIYGYCWLDDDVIYNVFSKQHVGERNYGATDMLYLVIKNHTNGPVKSFVDEWNKKSINVFKKLGFNLNL
jgi:hypothetical protein